MRGEPRLALPIWGHKGGGRWVFLYHSHQVDRKTETLADDHKAMSIQESLRETLPFL